MSHELRTPLTAIIGFSEMMEHEPFGALGSPKYRDYCTDIRASGQYLLNVISDVLDMSRLESGLRAFAEVALCHRYGFIGGDCLDRRRHRAKNRS